MTRDQFQMEIDVKKEFDFTERGVEYNIRKETDSNGVEKYIVSEGVLPPMFVYFTFGEMMADCVISNHYLRDIIRDL